jgi:hypothetical protein
MGRTRTFRRTAGAECPLTLVIAFGGFLLTAYLKGVKDESSEEAEAAGRGTVRWLRDKVAGVFDRDPDQAAAASGTALQQAIDDLAAAPDGTVPYVQSDSAAELIVDVLRGYGMSAKAAERAASTVRLQAVTLVVRTEQ